MLRNVFLQCVRSDAFRCPGFPKSERKRVELFGFLFLRYLVFILDAVNFSDCLNCATGKDLRSAHFSTGSMGWRKETPHVMTADSIPE